MRGKMTHLYERSIYLLIQVNVRDEIAEMNAENELSEVCVKVILNSLWLTIFIVSLAY